MKTSLDLQTFAKEKIADTRPARMVLYHHFTYYWLELYGLNYMNTNVL